MRTLRPSPQTSCLQQRTSRTTIRDRRSGLLDGYSTIDSTMWSDGLVSPDISVGVLAIAERKIRTIRLIILNAKLTGRDSYIGVSCLDNTDLGR